MAKIKTVMCLGNQTENSDLQSKSWAELIDVPYQGLLTSQSDLKTGLYFPDLSFLTMDDIWQITDGVDLLILLNQAETSYDFKETFQHFNLLCKYKKRSMHVLIDPEDVPTLWLTDYRDNKQILPDIINKNIQNANLIIKLSTVDDLDLFQNQLIELTSQLKSRQCRWLFYRAGKHEPLHYEVTKLLLNYPEFVLLNPAVFQGNSETNIQKRLYAQWIELYL